MLVKKLGPCNWFSSGPILFGDYDYLEISFEEDITADWRLETEYKEAMLRYAGLVRLRKQQIVWLIRLLIEVSGVRLSIVRVV